MSTNRSIPCEILRDRLAWLALMKAHQADPVANPPPDSELLISGLRKGDSPRWEIGIEDALVKNDPEDDEPFVELWLERPDGLGLDYIWLDSEGAFALQALLCFGGRFRMHEGESSGPAGELSWYLRCYLPGGFEVDSNRLIVDAQRGYQAKLRTDPNDKDAWKDQRRKGLGRTITDPQAARIHRHPPRHSRIGRPEATNAARDAWRRNRKNSGLKVRLKAYTDIIRQGWDLLDIRKPLGHEETRVPAPRKPRRKKKRAR